MALNEKEGRICAAVLRDQDRADTRAAREAQGEDAAVRDGVRRMVKKGTTLGAVSGKKTGGRQTTSPTGI